MSPSSGHDASSQSGNHHGQTRRKIALISGGATGIGAETAEPFQAEGATVVVTGSSERSAAAAKAALPGIEVIVSDASYVAATKALVDMVKAKHGRIDVLFDPRPPRLQPTTKRLRIIFGGKTIADTVAGYRVLETSHPLV